MSYFIFVNIHLNLHGILQSISLKENLSGICQGLFQDTCERVTDRKARGPQEAGGNKLQVADISFLFFLLHTKLKEVSRQHLVLSWANQCIFLMEMFFLSYVNETMCLLWNLPFFKKIPSETFFSPLKSWADNGSTNQYSSQLFHGQRRHTSGHSISKMHIMGEGPGETPSALRCLSCLINSLLAPC